MIKKKEVRVCDFCKEEIGSIYIFTEAVPNEGCSIIFLKDGGHLDGKRSFEIGGQDYCNTDCMVSDIKKSLKI